MIYRVIEPAEYEVLGDFLYEAIFIPDGSEPPPRDAILTPSLEHYIKDFGRFGRAGDTCFVCEDSGRIVGAAWSRILDEPGRRGYGNIGDGIPELAISVLPEYRNKGIGTDLIRRVHDALSAEGYDKISLSVQKKNPALRLYERCGYRTIREQDEDYIMVRRLDARRLDAQDRGRPKSDDTHLVATCIDSHSKPLADFNIEDLRIMIRQQIGLETLIPMAVSELEKDPLAKGDLYPGDLLVSVLRVPNDYWENHKEEASAVKRIIKPLNIPRSGWPGLDFDYWESVADK